VIVNCHRVIVAGVCDLLGSAIVSAQLEAVLLLTPDHTSNSLQVTARWFLESAVDSIHSQPDFKTHLFTGRYN